MLYVWLLLAHSARLILCLTDGIQQTDKTALGQSSSSSSFVLRWLILQQERWRHSVFVTILDLLANSTLGMVFLYYAQWDGRFK